MAYARRRPVVERILAINQAIREEAFAGMPAQARDTVIDILDGIKDNLALREERTMPGRCSAARACCARGQLSLEP